MWGADISVKNRPWKGQGKATGVGTSMCKAPGAALSLARELASCSLCQVGPVSLPQGLQSSPRNKSWSFRGPLSAPLHVVQNLPEPGCRGEGAGGQAGELAGLWRPGRMRTGGGRWPWRSGPEQACATYSATRDLCGWLRASPVS